MPLLRELDPMTALECACVDRDQRMTQEQWEALVASHVEALIELGWHWEGRGLMPGWEPWHQQEAR